MFRYWLLSSPCACQQDGTGIGANPVSAPGSQNASGTAEMRGYSFICHTPLSATKRSDSSRGRSPRWPGAKGM